VRSLPPVRLHRIMGLRMPRLRAQTPPPPAAVAATRPGAAVSSRDFRDLLGLLGALTLLALILTALTLVMP
jgi:hypothetical protein